MLLINKISLGDFINYKEEHINCLTHNSNNGYISEIFVFIDGNHKDLPIHPKIKYFTKKQIDEYQILDISKKYTSREKIIWSKKSLIGFSEDLRFLINEPSIYKSKDFIIINKTTKISKDLVIDEHFKSPKLNLVDFGTIQKVRPNLFSEKNGTNTTRKKGEIVKTQPKELTKSLNVIIVSVNYNDFLLTTLTRNINIFDNITVITSTEDKMCQMICEKFGVNLITSDIMYDSGAKFNKGKAINLAIKSIKDPGYILLIDADIIVKEKINTENLDPETLYTSDRWMCESYEDLLKSEKEFNGLKKYTKNESDRGLGFFQLFHSSKAISYPETSDNAAFSDLLFRDKFPKKKNINNTIIHIGKSYANWDGRTTDRFIEDEDFQKLFDSINKKFNINDYFDKIYCLNLERNSEKWQKANVQFKKLKINVDRFLGIDGNDITDEEFKEMSNKKISEIDSSKLGLIENKYALACLMSHIEIIKEAKLAGYKRILIFEDDVILSNEFNERISEIKKLNWSLLYLGASQFNWTGVKVNNGLYNCSNTLGTFAYAIDSNIFDDLIELFETKRKSIDNLLSEYQLSSSQSFVIYPNIVISDVTQSDIRQSKDMSEYSKLMKWNLNDFIIDKSNFEVINLSKNKTGKKILFLINLNDVGGAEYVSYQHIKICKRLGYRPVVISATKGMFFEKINELEVDLYYSELNKIDKSLIIEVLKELSEDCEIIYNCNYFGITTYIQELRKQKSFTYYTIAHSDIEWVINSIYEFDEITDKYIVIHDKIRNELNKKSVCNTKIFTVPNFIDYEEIKMKSDELYKSEIRREIGLNPEDFVVGMVTRISPDKNILDALKVIKEVSKKIKDIKLLIVGESPNREESKPYRNETMDYIKSLEIEDKVIITGHIDNNEVYKYIKCFDVSLNTSPSEGLPISMLEQMACGVHCVYPSHGEIPNVLEGFGTVINIKQKKSFEPKDSENYIFSRYSNKELQPFIDEIVKIYSGDKIQSEKISEHIKYTRNAKIFDYYFDFLYGGYKDGVTFLIRARNEEENVEECILSILDVADEIIFVDHLSTDNTYQKVNEISQKNNKVKLFKYDREVPKPGLNYRENIVKIGNSISNYYNFCLSKVTKKTVIKWDADFLGVTNNLSEMITQFNLRTREDMFSLWFTGKTLFKHKNKSYINQNSYYDEFRSFSMKKGVKWEDALRCEYVIRDYANNSISLRYENICFYEIKRTNVDEFSSRDTLIDRRDEVDYHILNELNENRIPDGLKLYKSSELKFILICATGRSGSTTLQRIISTIPNSIINGENHGTINNLLQSYVNIKKAFNLRENSIPKNEDGTFYDLLSCENNNIKPCWSNCFDIQKYKNSLKNLILEILSNDHSDKNVIGFKEIRYYENINLMDTFVELFPNTKIICHYKEDIDSQVNSESKNNWWCKNDKEYLLEYNNQLKEYSSNRDFSIEFTFEKLFDLEEVEKLFDFLEEDLDIEKYQNIIKNNLN